MLSICIPVYCYDVRPLVNTLLRQAEELEETMEVLVYDDDSPNDGNWGREELRQTPGIRYVELEQNLGRAAIRNKMAQEASFDFLLMMDADGAPGEDYLDQWFEEIRRIQLMVVSESPRFVSVGGRHYQNEKPHDPNFNLHWWYGRQRESFSLEKRKKQSWLGFHSNNFVVSRSVLLDHPFPETHTGYGHEDTLWGQQFIDSEVLICHLYNPVIHLGLETKEVFLQKQKQAISNLCLLKSSHPHLRTRLINITERFPFLTNLTRIIPEQRLVDYLIHNKRPSLYALDLLKLRWWADGKPQ